MERAPIPGSRRAERLDPTWVDRLSRLTRPGPARLTTVRRVLAAALALVAAVLLVRGDPANDGVAVVAAAHDLTPGSILGADDVRLVELGAATVPAGSLRAIDDAVGHTLTGPARTGEPLTDVRILGPRLANAVTGTPDARVVPIRLADPEVTDLLREGDRVDVLTVDADGPTPDARVLASAATVILVSPKDSGRGARERVVMLALPAGEATTVAAASLSTALTVTFH